VEQAGSERLTGTTHPTQGANNYRTYRIDTTYDFAVDIQQEDMYAPVENPQEAVR
jgi:hypothetical protein